MGGKVGPDMITKMASCGYDVSFDGGERVETVVKALL
jgi:hypothetical protein